MRLCDILYYCPSMVAALDIGSQESLLEAAGLEVSLESRLGRPHCEVYFEYLSNIGREMAIGYFYPDSAFFLGEDAWKGVVYDDHIILKNKQKVFWEPSVYGVATYWRNAKITEYKTYYPAGYQMVIDCVVSRDLTQEEIFQPRTIDVNQTQRAILEERSKSGRSK